MEFPIITRLNKLGDQHAEWWMELPSWENPDKSNWEVIFGGIQTDIEHGRPLSQRYLNPLKDAARQGVIAAAENHQLSLDEMADLLRKYSPDTDGDVASSNLND